MFVNRSNYRAIQANDVYFRPSETRMEIPHHMPEKDLRLLLL
jgi:hypothetical protein